MNSSSLDSKHNTRRSRWFHWTEGLASNVDYSSSLYGHMLIEDLSQGLIPNAQYQQNAEVDIRLDPANPVLQLQIMRALRTSHRDPRDLPEAITDFVDDTATSIAHYGEAFYEIVFYSNGPDVYTSFTLESIPPWSLKRGLLSFIQRQPVDVHQSKHTARFKRVRIPRDYVVHFTFPGGYFGSSGYRSLLGRICKLSDRETPIKFMSGNSQWSGFDFTHYNNAEIVGLARSTRRLGWNARQLFNEKANEFYWVHRHLAFQLTRARLRESIVATLNEALRRVGAHMGFQATVTVAGVPTAKEIAKVILDVQAGKVELSVAIERVKF